MSNDTTFTVAFIAVMVLSALLGTLVRRHRERVRDARVARLEAMWRCQRKAVGK